MRRSERRNNLQICPRRDSNTGGSDLWSSTLPLEHGGAPQSIQERTKRATVDVQNKLHVLWIDLRDGTKTLEEFLRGEA